MKKPRIEDSNTTGETPDRYSDYSGHDSLRHKKSRSHRVSLGGDCGGAPPEEVTDDPGPKIDLPAGEEERNAGADQEPGAGEQAATKTTQESKSSEVNQPKESSPANSLEGRKGGGWRSEAVGVCPYRSSGFRLHSRANSSCFPSTYS